MEQQEETKEIEPGSLERSNKVRVLEVIGSIGAGKSFMLLRKKELIEIAKRRYPDITLDNSIFILQDVKNWFFLDKFYKEPKKYANWIQLEIFCSYMKELTKRLNEEWGIIKYVFTESGLHESLYVYCQNSADQGFISVKENELFLSLVNSYEAMYDYDFIYIKTNLITCLRRIRERGRKGEEHLTMGTLYALEHLRTKLIYLFETQHLPENQSILTLYHDIDLE